MKILQLPINIIDRIDKIDKIDKINFHNQEPDMVIDKI